jgi:hypothetical protein
MASSPGPRVKMGAIAVPSRSSLLHCAAAASGANPSAPLTSADQASV